MKIINDILCNRFSMIYILFYKKEINNDDESVNVIIEVKINENNESNTDENIESNIDENGEYDIIENDERDIDNINTLNEFEVEEEYDLDFEEISDFTLH